MAEQSDEILELIESALKNPAFVLGASNDALTVPANDTGLSNRYQKAEIEALIFYLARENGVDIGLLRRTVFSSIPLADPSKLTVRDHARLRLLLLSHFANDKS